MASLRELPYWLAILLFAVLSYVQYPGHTFLESDTQIYVPMLERLEDRALLERDPLVVRTHMAFTLYDEVARGLRRLTGLSLEAVLGVLQVVVRVALLAGIFLITRAMGLSEALALACAGIYALGGWVRGPSVLLVEYEPVPRGFAMGPLVLGIGLAAHRRYLAAGIAGAVAFLLHATAAAAFWVVFAVLLFVPDELEEMKSRFRGLLALAVAVIILKIAASLQPGVTEPQAFLGRIDAAWEKLLRLRAAYVWVDMWPRLYFWQYGLMLAPAAAAFWRLRLFVQPALRFFVVGLSALGLLSLPVSYLLLEKMKLAILPQVQPLRTILFLEMFSMLLALVMAFELACREKRILAAGLWAALAVAIGIDARLLFALAPLAVGFLVGNRLGLLGIAAALSAVLAKPFGMVLWKGTLQDELLVAIVLGALLVGAAVLSVHRRIAGSAAVVTVVLLAFYLVPGRLRFGSGQQNHPELAALSGWARTHTGVNAVFLFPEAGRGNDPGIFRALAARALYVDWKGGGQINFFHDFARIWWSRWQETMADPFQPERLPHFRELSINYIVLSSGSRLADRRPVFENSKYRVYSVEAAGDGTRQ